MTVGSRVIMDNLKEKQLNSSKTDGSSADSGALGSSITVELPSIMTVNDLALLIGIDSIEAIKYFMRVGEMLAINDVIDYDLAESAAKSFGFTVKPIVTTGGQVDSIVDPNEDSSAKPKAPVVTILGHVDHGKTTLLDSIRNSHVVDVESGSITQHIGAYRVSHDGKDLTFLDTPGHEAFTEMRARGAHVTDICVLVVAADDGIMPQTIEAMGHIKAAGVPMVVAINKIDLPGADQEKVKRQLSEHDILIEEWGGEVPAVSVSGLQGEGITELLSNILVIAEVSELVSNPDQPGRGIAIEARTDRSRGVLVTVIVQAGTFLVGDYIVAGGVRGRIRAMLDDNGKRLERAGPSIPVEISGLSELPEAGYVVQVVPDAKSAKAAVEDWEIDKRLNPRQKNRIKLTDVYSKIASGDVKTLNLIVKTDVQGSIDAIGSIIAQLNTDETRVNLVHIASGTITDGDILLAIASQAVVVGFNSMLEQGARALSNQESVDVRVYDVIYNLADDLEMALKGLLEPETRTVVEGYATVRAIFKLGRGTVVAGVYVNEGVISRGAEINLSREGQVLYEGSVRGLRHFKNDVSEIRAGLEGGIILDVFKDFQEGDVLEARHTETI